MHKNVLERSLRHKIISDSLEEITIPDSDNDYSKISPRHHVLSSKFILPLIPKLKKENQNKHQEHIKTLI